MGTSDTYGKKGFSAREAGDAMWQAFDDLRSQFDRKVAPRMGRGDVRTAILALLDEQPMHGYQVIREIEERTQGRWKPSAGSVYPTLQLLADEGLVTAEVAEDRKIYALTAEGREAAAAVAGKAPWVEPEPREGSHFGPVPKAAFELAQAATQVARSGTEAQQSAAAEVLEGARRKIYSILAED